MQAEDFFLTAIDLVPELPLSADNVKWLRGYVKQFASALLVVPGHPAMGPFYLVKRLINHVRARENVTRRGLVGQMVGSL